jgi:hypothetical protein
MKIVISEQQLRRIITEQSSTVVVKGSFTPTVPVTHIDFCDELHAFQSTGGKDIGNMNVIVGNKLEELYNNGMNPMVSNVSVSVKDNKVNWTCTIVPSPDGKAWVGFTSRGAGCNNDIIKRAESVSQGNDIGTAKKKIMTKFKESNIDIEKVNDFVYKGGKNSFKQVFYRYTKPNSFPPVNGPKTTPINKSNNTPVSGGNENYDTLRINTSDLTSFIQEVRTKTQGLTVSLGSLKTDITPDNCSFEILYVKPGRKDVSGTCKKIKRFTVALSTQNEGEAAADNILSKNPESKVIRKGTFVENGNTRTWKLIAVM